MRFEYYCYYGVAALHWYYYIINSIIYAFICPHYVIINREISDLYLTEIS
jgi:hypothetical protein